MKFDEWWATLSPPERRVIGEHNARFVWGEAVEVCAKVCEDCAAIIDTPNAYIDGPSNNAKRKALQFADAIRDKGNIL